MSTSTTNVRFGHLRVARPTNHMNEILRFYRDGLGMDVLSEFRDHEGFDGVMLGQPGLGWHLEFTHHHSHDAKRAPTEDNLIVLYLPDTMEWQRAVDRMIAHGYTPVPSLNPYWEQRGKTFEDIDGYRVVLEQDFWST